MDFDLPEVNETAVALANVKIWKRHTLELVKCIYLTFFTVSRWL